MTQRSLFKILLIGLPVGLALIGGGSLVVHAMREKKSSQSESTAVNRRPVAQKDLEQFVRVLSEKIGPRHPGNSASVRQTLAFLTGTLGPNNFGYQEVQRSTWPVPGGEATHVAVEVPGRGRRGEIILVAARWDTAGDSPGANDNASGVAALLAVAQAFVGAPQERTLRCVSLGGPGKSPASPENPAATAYAAACQSRGEKITGVIVLDSMGHFTDSPGSQKHSAEIGASWPDTGNFLALLRCGQETDFHKGSLRHLSEASSLPVQGDTLPEIAAALTSADAWAFARAGFPALLVTDTGSFRRISAEAKSDTPETISFDRFTLAVKALERMLHELLNPDTAAQRETQR